MEKFALQRNAKFALIDLAYKIFNETAYYFHFGTRDSQNKRFRNVGRAAKRENFNSTCKRMKKIFEKTQTKLERDGEFAAPRATGIPSHNPKKQQWTLRGRVAAKTHVTFGAGNTEALYPLNAYGIRTAIAYTKSSKQ